MMAAALSTYLAGPQQIMIVRDSGEVSELERAIVTRYLPFALTLSLTPDQQRELGHRRSAHRAMKPVSGAAAAYVCRDFVCRPPVTSVLELEEIL